MNEKSNNGVTENVKQPKSEQYYIDVVSAMAERTIMRLWIIIIALLVIVCGLTYLYVDLWRSIETAEITQDIDTGEGNAIVAGIGDVHYGEGETNDKSNAP